MFTDARFACRLWLTSHAPYHCKQLNLRMSSRYKPRKVRKRKLPTCSDFTAIPPIDQRWTKPEMQRGVVCRHIPQGPHVAYSEHKLP